MPRECEEVVEAHVAIAGEVTAVPALAGRE